MIEEGLDADVAAEAARVRDRAYGGARPAVELRGVGKAFFRRSGRTRIRFDAVSNVSYSIGGGELFCLLGHNGAGKTTTIAMLTGLTDLSSGTATIFGLDVATQSDQLCRIMGVCPQVCASGQLCLFVSVAFDLICFCF